ncbi:hypothetical protein N7453_002258 [Penicillium expansum]|nr:hypothetical protein N7453_002258 [Penicillium expansum]
MVLQVRQDQIASEMWKGKDRVNFLVRLGPSNVLKGREARIIDAIASNIGAPQALYHVASRLCTANGTVELALVNEYSVQDTQHPPPPG